MGSAPLFIEYIAARILPDIISIKKKQNNWYFSQMQPDSVWKSRRSVPSGGIVNNARNRLVSDLIMVTGCRLMPCRRNFHRSTHDDDTVCRACANPRVKLHKREAFWGGLERGSYTRGQLQRDFPDDRLNSFEARSWLMNFVLTLEKIIARISCFLLQAYWMDLFFLLYLFWFYLEILEEKEIYLQEINRLMKDL